jgi:hypothetical protein
MPTNATKRAARPGRVGTVRGGEPEPDEQLVRRFAALGPGGPEALAELWKRPRFRERAWLILDLIGGARVRLRRGRPAYEADNAVRDRERKAPLPLAEWEPSAGGQVDIRRPVEGRRLSFRLRSGRSVEDDVLAELREQLRRHGLPSRGPRNVLAALVALARS